MTPDWYEDLAEATDRGGRTRRRDGVRASGEGISHVDSKRTRYGNE